MSGKKPSIRMGKQPAVQAVPDTPTPVSEPITKKDQIWIAAYAVLLFLAMTVQTGRMSMILLVLALALSVGRAPLGHLRQRFCVPVLGFIAFSFVQGFAAIYSHFGDYAVAEYQKYLAAFALAVPDGRELLPVAQVQGVVFADNADGAQKNPSFLKKIPLRG